MKAKTKAKKRGRPRKSRTGYLRAGASIDEGRRLAIFGRLDMRPGVGIAHQIWIELNNQNQWAYDGAEAASVQASEAERRDRALGLAKDFASGDIASRLVALDSDYFRNIADTFDALKAGCLPDLPQYAALAAYAAIGLENDSNHKFTNSELMNKVKWGSRRPEDRQLNRLTKRLALPMAPSPRGRPKK